MLMKKFSAFITLSLFFLFIYWFFLRPRFESKNVALCGEVVCFIERKRAGGYTIEVNENGRSKFIENYPLSLKDCDIKIGDSVFKEAGSDELFVRSKSDRVKHLTDGQDAFVTQ